MLAAIAGAMLGLGAIYLRSDRGLGAAEVGERAPDHAGTIGAINMAHIPVMGIGGAGVVAIAIIVGLTLPEGSRLLSFGLTGAIVGAGSLIAWRHYHSGTPFTEDQGETLHLRRSRQRPLRGRTVWHTQRSRGGLTATTTERSHAEARRARSRIGPLPGTRAKYH